MRGGDSDQPLSVLWTVAKKNTQTKYKILRKLLSGVRKGRGIQTYRERRASSSDR